MSENTELIIKEETEVRLGSMILESPKSVIAHATAIATELANVIDSRKLYAIISGKKFVKAEGWTTLGAMLGVVPVETETKINEYDDFYEYEAAVELIRVSDGAKVGGASAVCSSNEKNWMDRPRNALRSMAITRATGKAFRLSFSWIVVMAGYSPTPAEEMDGVVDASFKNKTKSDSDSNSWSEKSITRVIKDCHIVTDEAAIELLDASGFAPKASVAAIGKFTKAYQAGMDQDMKHDEAMKHAQENWNK